ncbi:MAG: radical SAM protein [Alphaproteobacteria bacterium]
MQTAATPATTSSTTAPAGKRRFRVVMIKPSHYDERGYVIQWWKAWVPSNSLASVYGLLLDADERQVLGPDVAIDVDAYDECNRPVPFDKLIAELKPLGNMALVGLVGVQSNQYPRALDMARRFRAAGIPVAIGGFHVSGVLSMLKEPTLDLQEALDMGVTLYAGEAEGRIGDLLADAMNGDMKPIYNYMDDLPGLQGQPIPFLPAELIQRYDGSVTSFDAGRGCPFQCSFCTIINVQGRISRWRDADDIERIVRANLAQGIDRYFITDDNFARNRNWEAIFDRLIELKERDGLEVSFVIQVDTLCHRIPGFIEKAARAGCGTVFIGLENINPASLAHAKKRQNKITEYRVMFQAWRDAKVITYAGYILGFPNETAASIKHDIEVIQRELPVDMLAFTLLTPLPGSEDHRNMYKAGTWMDPDLNKYDLEHVTVKHPLMSPEELQQVYRDAWDWYFTDAHVETLMRRAVAGGIKPVRIWQKVLQIGAVMKFHGVHPQQGGFLRLRLRKDRRVGLPIEPVWSFYPKRAWELISTYGGMALYAWRLHRIRKRVQADPASKTYTDQAIEAVEQAETEELEMFTMTDAAREAVNKAQRLKGHAPAA